MNWYCPAVASVSSSTRRSAHPARASVMTSAVPCSPGAASFEPRNAPSNWHAPQRRDRRRGRDPIPAKSACGSRRPSAQAVPTPLAASVNSPAEEAPTSIGTDRLPAARPAVRRGRGGGRRTPLPHRAGRTGCHRGGRPNPVPPRRRRRCCWRRPRFPCPAYDPDRHSRRAGIHTLLAKPEHPIKPAHRVRGVGLAGTTRESRSLRPIDLDRHCRTTPLANSQVPVNRSSIGATRPSTPPSGRGWAARHPPSPTGG